MARRLQLLLVCLLTLASACGRDAASAPEEPAKPAAAAAPAKPRPLAEATNPSLPLIVEVLEAKRATVDTVNVAFAVINTGTGEKAEALRPFGNAKAADFCLITADGARRLFLLRDTKNEPVLEGDLEHPLKPGERRQFQAAFPAPPAASVQPGQAVQPVTVTLVAGPYVLRNVPIAPQPPIPDARR